MNRHDLIIWLKTILYRNGESYLFASRKLKFVPGTRPIQRKYINSHNDVVRNDVLQIEYFENNFKPSDILWDIGSHHGHYSIFAASIVKNSNQVYSFEPDIQAMMIQEENIKINDFEAKISLLNTAISNIDGCIKFASLDGNSNSHIVKEMQKGSVNVVSVQSHTLNHLLDIYPAPTFIKIDTEGAEINILSSGSYLLANSKVKFICELHPFAWRSFNVTYSQITAILKKFNRQIHLLDPKKQISDLPYYGTVIF